MTADLPQRRVIEQRGLYFDELETGVVYAHKPGRTVTETDNVIFTTMTMNIQALHLDAAWSAGQPFGQRLVNSMFTLATVVGQSVPQLTQGTIVAQLGLTDVSFPHPLYHGDTLYTETEIADKRLSASRPGQGIVTMRHTGRNQELLHATRELVGAIPLRVGKSDFAEHWMVGGTGFEPVAPTMSR